MSKNVSDQNDSIPLTVVMRSYNDAPLLPKTLAALDEQEGVDVTLGIMEGASTDGSTEIFEAHGYEWIEKLDPGGYWSSEVLNRGAQRAKTELVVFLNSDAVMGHPKVLRMLADAILNDPKVAGAFGAQTAREGAGLMTRIEYAQAFGRRSELGEAGRWMSLVCSAVRRSVWEQVPFDERITYAEDAVWSRRVLETGYEIAYLPDAMAEHSHDYGWEERYRRAYGDASALAVMETDPPPGRLAGLVFPWIKKSLRFGWETVRMGKPWMIAASPFYAWPLAKGAWAGSRAGWEHFHGTEAVGDKFDPKS